MNEPTPEITYMVYIRGRDIPLKLVQQNAVDTPERIRNRARQIALDGFFHDFETGELAFISPIVIEEVHWENPK